MSRGESSALGAIFVPQSAIAKSQLLLILKLRLREFDAVRSIITPELYAL
jgi:hypothetical protein